MLGNARGIEIEAGDPEALDPVDADALHKAKSVLVARARRLREPPSHHTPRARAALEPRIAASLWRARRTPAPHAAHARAHMR